MSEMARNEGPLWPCGCLVGSPYCDCSDHEDPAPVDWPDRFRTAADAADDGGWYATGELLRALARDLEDVDEVETIGRALLGERP